MILQKIKLLMLMLTCMFVGVPKVGFCNNIANKSNPYFLGDFTEFWGFRSDVISFADINTFNLWHKNSKFKSISPKIDNAYFFRSPSKNDVTLDENGQMVFSRYPGDTETHTMVQISVNNEPTRGHFIDYGGYRFMSIKVPYEIEMEVMAVGGDWIKKVPWMLAFQGHAVPNLINRNAKFNPPFALLISKGRWAAHIRADSRAMLPSNRKYERFEKIDLGPVQPDQWTRFRIRVAWDYEKKSATNEAFLAIWRDGTLYHSEEGKQTFYNSFTPLGLNFGPYLHVGAYAPLFNHEHGPITIKLKELTFRAPGL